MTAPFLVSSTVQPATGTRSAEVAGLASTSSNLQALTLTFLELTKLAVQVPPEAIGSQSTLVGVQANQPVRHHLMGVVVVGRRQRIEASPGVAAVGARGLGVDDGAVLGQLHRPAGDGHAVGGSGRVGVHVLELAGLDLHPLRVDKGSIAGPTVDTRRAVHVDGCPGEPVGWDGLMHVVVVRRNQRVEVGPGVAAVGAGGLGVLHHTVLSQLHGPAGHGDAVGGSGRVGVHVLELAGLDAGPLGVDEGGGTGAAGGDRGAVDGSGRPGEPVGWDHLMGIVVVGRRQGIEARPGVAAVGPSGLGVDDGAVLGQLHGPAGDGHAVGGSGRVGVHVLELAGRHLHPLRVDEVGRAGAAGGDRVAGDVDRRPGEPVGWDHLMGIVVVGRRQRVEAHPGVAAVRAGGLGVDDGAVLGQLDGPAGDGHAVGRGSRVGVHVLELAGLDVDLLRVDEVGGAGAAGGDRVAVDGSGRPGEPVGWDHLMGIVVVGRRQRIKERPGVAAVLAPVVLVSMTVPFLVNSTVQPATGTRSAVVAGLVSTSSNLQALTLTFFELTKLAVQVPP